MSNRYVTFEKLSVVFDKWSPSGELRGHHAKVIHQDDTTIIVVGSREGRAVLKPGDTLGYSKGKVWAIPNPQSFSDPIRRFLAEKRIVQRKLLFSDDPVIWVDQTGYRMPGSSDDLRQADLMPQGLGSIENVLVRDESDLESLKDQLRGPEGSVPGHRLVMEARGGEAIVIRRIMKVRHASAKLPSLVGRIVVRTTADRQKVADWLKRLL